MIPFCRTYIGDEEVKAFKRVLDSGQLSQGDEVEKFESMFADYVGAEYAIATNSCTSALFLSLKSLGIGSGHKVIVPSLTFNASASVIRQVGAEIIFRDVSRETLCLDFSHCEDDEPDAMVNVHLTGRENPFDWEYCIDDSAHLIERDCYMGNIQCFSFHPTKNMTTGFGGMIALNDKDKADWLKKARVHGMDYKKKEQKWGYDIEFDGYKMNMNDIQAAIGREQLKKLDWMNEQRERCISRYNDNLGLNRIGLHLYPIFVRNRLIFMEKMQKAGIQCSIHFEPLHRMTAYKDVELDKPLTNTEWVGERICSVPLFPELSNKEIDYICQQIQETNLLILQ